MKPEPNELIDGIRDLLRGTIAPELKSDAAIAALRRIMVILKETDWNEAAFQIAHENRILADLLRVARDWASASAKHADLAATLEQAAGTVEESFASFRAVADRNAFLRKTLADFVSAVAEDGSAPGTDRLRSRMADALATLGGPGRAAP